MVHLIANLGVFFAFLIQSGAWVMLKLLGYCAAALAFVLGLVSTFNRARRRYRRRR